MSIGGKRPGAGRPPGSLNKKSLEIEQLLDDLGVNPVVGMANLASNNKTALGISEDVPIAVRAQMYRELMSYVASKPKAIELTIDDSMMRHEHRLEHLK